MEQYRVVDTPQGPQTYLLVKKRVKNLNLRLDRRGQILLSVPFSCPEERADALILEKWEWIRQHLSQQSESAPLLPEPDRAACVRLLGEAVVKLRKMRSQWGNCHYQQGYITLNTALARCPEPLRDYVALHELVHFLHHDHGPGFYAAMDARMPDWRARRQKLKGYARAIVE